MTLFNPSRLLDVDIGATMGNNAPLGERLSLALEVTILGMATVFAVLIIIWTALALLRVLLYGIPSKKTKEASDKQAPKENPVPTPSSADTVAAVVTSPAVDDKQLVAVITAAIAASEGKPASSLRVVSFRRAGAPRWNER